MAQITVMSYKDAGAPQIIANNRTALYGLLDVWMETGYNSKFVKNLYTKPDRTITLEYATPHGYKRGHLLKITGATDPIFNKKFRVWMVTADTVVLRIDQTDTATYPLVDSSISIQSVVAPADWKKVYSSATKRTYQSKLDQTKSSRLYYTISEPFNPLLKTAGACCYSVDISKEFDVASGSPLNSVLDSQRTPSDGTNYYILTDCYTAPLTNVNNGRAGTWLPWFVIATESFVFFLIGSNGGSALVTNPDITTHHYRNYIRQTGYYVNHRSYWFGDLLAHNPQEYINRTSGFCSFYKFSPTNNDVLDVRFMPNTNLLNGYDSNQTFLTDTYISQNTFTKCSVNTPTMIGNTYSGASGNYLPYPAYNITGLLTSDFYVFQQNNSTANSGDTILRGTVPSCVYVHNSFRSMIPNEVEGNPFILEPSGSIYDEFLMMHQAGYSSTNGDAAILSNGFCFFKLD